MIKEKLFTHIIGLLDKKIESARQAIASAREARDNETKSSVGDKYETARTLMQFELEKNRALLHKTENLKKELLRIDLQKKYEKAEFGSLVFTGAGNFFISVALGKIEVEKKGFFCISLASPIGKQLHAKKAGDTFALQGKQIEIIEIL